MFNRTEWSTKRAVHYNMGERKVLVKRRAKTLLIGMIAWFLLAAPVNAIQILENEQFVQGQRVKHTISIGITPAQIALGPIGGFFVNLFLFPFVGPSPEIISIEFDITNIEYTEDIEGTADISADGLEAIWEFDTMILEQHSRNQKI